MQWRAVIIFTETIRDNTINDHQCNKIHSTLSFKLIFFASITSLCIPICLALPVIADTLWSGSLSREPYTLTVGILSLVKMLSR